MGMQTTKFTGHEFEMRLVLPWMVHFDLRNVLMDISTKPEEETLQNLGFYHSQSSKLL